MAKKARDYNLATKPLVKTVNLLCNIILMENVCFMSRVLI